MKKQVAMFILGIFFILIILNVASAADRNVGPGYTYTNITAAINAASTGDTINVYDNGAPYTYNENVVINKTNLTITAKGNVTVRAKNPNSAVFSIDPTGNGSSISNFKITGATNSYGVFCGGSSYNTIRNNTIFNNWIGIRMPMGNSHNTITNNTIYNNQEGIYIDGDIYTTISGNIIENNIAGAFGTGINSQGSNHLIITSNIIKNSPMGIHLDGSSNTTISNNNLLNNTDVGINLFSMTNCQIIGNNISLSTDGIILSTPNPDYPTENNTIRGNNVNNCGHGIRLDYANKNIIEKNTINSNLMGIASYTSGQNIIKENTLSDNELAIYSVSENLAGNDFFKNIITSNYNGIAFSGSSNNKIYENTISNNTKTGIDIQGATGNSITGNKITGNNIGIHTDDVNQTNVHFNSIVGNTLYGISNNFTSVTGGYGGIVNATYNWWGSNSDPSSKIQNTGTGSVIYNPWLVLKISSASNLIRNGIKTTITAYLTYDSNGGYHNPLLGHILNGIPIKFTTTLGTITSSASTVDGAAKATLTGGSKSGIAIVSAVLDNQTVKKSITVDATAPRVSWTVPKSGATGVSRTSTIVIKFSENIKTSINWNKMYVKNLSTGKLIPIGRSISGNTLYIKTSIRTAYTWYQVYIPGYSVKDSAGNNLASGYWFKFKTGRY
ncbi:right-handed parallel beta-helix repeat-containing protein [Methanobacterium oryzae]|uniref:right-handed parallel beta-helix repeat-containing protein n=1 Tax=Methanobacterium oryzae TaxID=69540 RepID=UPI003D238672